MLQKNFLGRSSRRLWQASNQPGGGIGEVWTRKTALRFGPHRRRIEIGWVEREYSVLNSIDQTALQGRRRFQMRRVRRQDGTNGVTGEGFDFRPFQQDSVAVVEQTFCCKPADRMSALQST